MEVRFQGLWAGPASLPWTLRPAPTRLIQSHLPWVPSTSCGWTFSERDVRREGSRHSTHRNLEVKIILDYLGELDKITRALKSGRGRPNIGVT